MPNTRPALDTPDRVAYESEESERVDGVRVLVAAAATEGIEGKALTHHGSLKVRVQSPSRTMGCP